MTSQSPQLFIGLMSGTSLDGVDGVLASFNGGAAPHIVATGYIAFPPDLRTDLLALQAPGENEIHREALAANRLAALYADCVHMLLQQAQCSSETVQAIGCHGQTIRHCPQLARQLGYTRQTNNPALLAELTGIAVIADFRSRDIAAGGHGAPLVPAFHQAVFARKDAVRVVANIGGMSNISILENSPHARGFDTGPGNVLLDAWIGEHRSLSHDADGAWAASGQVLPDLLQRLLAEPFFALPPPKSTGRDLFHLEWLMARLHGFENARPEDVQATLTALTARSLADAIARHAPRTEAVYVCGGGAYNAELLRQLRNELSLCAVPATIGSTEELGVAPNHVEALAFAWLAQRFTTRQPGNLPAVTGARGLRILGALYPAG
ncbi:MAG: anhydro-N-acetylmuramic acid kinase [Burkholderiaceae bacterium]|nr:anhydro-N-acetylmuramic acid kinase [Burkholderiaceae bacterium]